MELLLISLIAIFAGATALVIWVKSPIRSRLDRLDLAAIFGGFIWFGLDGAYVNIEVLNSQVRFLKRVDDDGDWKAEIVVSGGGISGSFVDGFQSVIALLSDQFEVNANCSRGSRSAVFVVAGRGLLDSDAMANLARRLCMELGYPDNVKCKVDFLGPTDHEAVEKYYKEVEKYIENQKRENRQERR